MAAMDHEYFGSVYPNNNPHEFIGDLTECLERAQKQGWTKLYFITDENGAVLYGRQPISAEEAAKKLERRRKQYEKLKQEFGE